MDDEAILISAIAHYGYCPRRCALIHVEQIFDENVFTLRGRLAHERVDTKGYESGGRARVERALPLWCERLGLYGKADAVEFRANGTLYPVEYKSAKRRPGLHDDLQLCAQAVCLEEMFGTVVERGAIFHIASRRRREVVFDEPLRERLEEVVAHIRTDLRSGNTPPPVYDSRCPNCSLLDACVPEVIAEARLAHHLRELYRIPQEESP